MSIERHDCDDGRTRVDRMIDEFRNAQSRRRAKATAVKGDDEVVGSPREAHAQAALAGPATTPPSPHD